MENQALVLDLVEWVAREPRAYEEVMDAWRTSCPRLTIWEDALDNGFVTMENRRVRVTDKGHKSWVLRYQRNGRRRDMGLGPYPEITHAAAREKALAARRQILDGIDPLDQVPEQKSTFREAAEDLIESKRPG